MMELVTVDFVHIAQKVNFDWRERGKMDIYGSIGRNTTYVLFNPLKKVYAGCEIKEKKMK